MTSLSVNVNKIALLRNSRTLGIPSVVKAATIALDAGAHGITVHPRPDGRHIRLSDVHDLAAMIAKRPGVEFNIEGNPFHEVLDVVRRVRPDQCTLVPDDPAAFTSDHGWNLVRDGERLRPVIDELRKMNVRVSLFMDPDPAGMRLAREIGADRVELYTEPYASAFGTAGQEQTLSSYVRAAEGAAAAGLGINAGHDLNLENLPVFLKAIPRVLEVSIGHALVADAIELGLAETVRRYLAACGAGR